MNETDTGPQPAPVSPDLECTVCQHVSSPHGVPVTAATPGQAAYEALHAARGERSGDVPWCVPWGELNEFPGVDIHREDLEVAAQAAIAAYIEANGRDPVDVRSVVAEALAAQDARPAPGDVAGLLDPLHALAAKWDATAARNQRNGQSLVDQGDEYGNEGLAVAEALGACVVDLRAVLADAPDAPAPKPAPELAAAMAVLRRVLEWFPTGGTRNEASATRAQLAAAYLDGGLNVPEELRKFLGKRGGQ
jgi:hypothetical protein